MKPVINATSLAGCTFAARCVCVTQQGPTAWQVIPCTTALYALQVNCTAAFQAMLAKVELPPRVGSPPKEMPADMVNDYLMNNQAHLRSMYEGGTVSHGKIEPHNWSVAVIEQLMSRARNGEHFSYPPAETATMYRALDAYPVADQAGLVVGSQTPWVEAILLVAGRCHTMLCDRLFLQVFHS